MDVKKNTFTSFYQLVSEKVFWNVLKEHYRVIDKKSSQIRELTEKFDQLKNAIDEIDMDACEEIIDHWENLL